MTTYSAGLLVSETTYLKLSDIYSQRMQIRVELGKGNKDCYTLLSERLLQKLRYYWRLYRPTDFLFPSKDTNKPINVTTIRRVMKDTREKDGITKPATVPTLRHSFATHLLEQGLISLRFRSFWVTAISRRRVFISTFSETILSRLLIHSINY
jgi:integrase/recombinase XerD